MVFPDSLLHFFLITCRFLFIFYLISLKTVIFLLFFAHILNLLLIYAFKMNENFHNGMFFLFRLFSGFTVINISRLISPSNTDRIILKFDTFLSECFFFNTRGKLLRKVFSFPGKSVTFIR